MNDRMSQQRRSAAMFWKLGERALTNRLRGQGSLRLIALDNLLPPTIGSCIINGVVPFMMEEQRQIWQKDLPAGDIIRSFRAPDISQAVPFSYVDW